MTHRTNPTRRPRAASLSCATSFSDICTRYNSKPALVEGLRRLGPTEPEAEDWVRHWEFHGRFDQRPPPDRGRAAPWTTWLVLGGRGAGKTRTGAEWIRGVVRGDPGFMKPGPKRIALLGETQAMVRDVMVEGSSGLLAVCERDRERPVWSPSLRRLDWPNGAVAQCFSAEEPDGLRGPQFGAAWSDELAKWRLPEAAWDNLQFALRLGAAPRQVVTTTPRPIPLVQRLMGEPGTVMSRARTAANARHLSPIFLDAIVGRYAGTRLGRQELDGEIVAERPDALWSRDGIERARVAAAPELARVVIAVDPPVSSGPRADACGIVAAGVDRAGFGYVLADATVQGLPPHGWAAAATAAYRRWEADALVVEANQGGELVRAVLAQVDPGVPVTTVHATRGKYLRAEPVAVLYDQGRVRHVGAFPDLEDEMTDLAPGGLSTGRSPDRLDALVWALTALMLGRAEPRVRVL